LEESREQILKREGWTRQFTANQPRLDEAVEMYEEAGFEVHLEPFLKQQKTPETAKLSQGADCRQCFDGFEDQYKIIYTKPSRDNPGLDKDLF